MNQTYLDQQNDRATKHLGGFRGQSGVPILDLILVAVVEYEGNFVKDFLVDQADLDEWQALYFDCPEELIESTLSVMKHDGFDVPEDEKAVCSWAECLIHETLTRR